jgi:hypothetical protein
MTYRTAPPAPAKRGLQPAPLLPQAPRQLRRLRLLGLIKKVSHTYRYYLTRLGRSAIAAACSLTRFSIVPAMACTR